MKKAEKTQKVPKWFKGEVYDQGDTVVNQFTGQKYYLNNVELSIYDLTKGAEMLGLWNDVRLGLDWFKENNAKAYMVLLD